MGVLDRLPGTGARGVVVAALVGALALVAAGALAWMTWGPQDDAEPVAGTTTEPALRTVKARGGGFEVPVPKKMKATRPGKAVRLVGAGRRVVVTVSPASAGKPQRVHEQVLSQIRAAYPKVSVEATVPSVLDGHAGLRSIGAAARDDGTGLVLTVTTAGSGKRAWAVTVFTARDVRPAEVERFVTPVLTGLRLGR
ncbi:hypothetical protein [Nocardioides pacificus]